MSTFTTSSAHLGFYDPAANTFTTLGPEVPLPFTGTETTGDGIFKPGEVITVDGISITYLAHTGSDGWVGTFLFGGFPVTVLFTNDTGLPPYCCYYFSNRPYCLFPDGNDGRDAGWRAPGRDAENWRYRTDGR